MIERAFVRRQIQFDRVVRDAAVVQRRLDAVDDEPQARLPRPDLLEAARRPREVEAGEVLVDRGHVAGPVRHVTVEPLAGDDLRRAQLIARAAVLERLRPADLLADFADFHGRIGRGDRQAAAREIGGQPLAPEAEYETAHVLRQHTRLFALVSDQRSLLDLAMAARTDVRGRADSPISGCGRSDARQVEADMKRCGSTELAMSNRGTNIGLRRLVFLDWRVARFLQLPDLRFGLLDAPAVRRGFPSGSRHSHSLDVVLAIVFIM